MSAIDSVGQLSFHTFKFPAFPRPKLPCFYLVHVLFSTFQRLPHAAAVENLYVLYIVAAQALYLKNSYNSCFGHETLLLETALVLAIDVIPSLARLASVALGLT